MPAIAEFPEQDKRGTIVYIDFNENCPRPMAELVAHRVAAARGIGSEVIPTGTPKEWQDVYRRTHGSAEQSSGDGEARGKGRDTVAAIFSVVARDATIVLNTVHTNSPTNYKHFADGLERVEAYVRDLTSRLN